MGVLSTVSDRQFGEATSRRRRSSEAAIRTSDRSRAAGVEHLERAQRAPVLPSKPARLLSMRIRIARLGVGESETSSRQASGPDARASSVRRAERSSAAPPPKGWRWVAQRAWSARTGNVPGKATPPAGIPMRRATSRLRTERPIESADPFSGEHFGEETVAGMSSSSSVFPRKPSAPNSVVASACPTSAGRGRVTTAAAERSAERRRRWWSRRSGTPTCPGRRWAGRRRRAGRSASSRWTTAAKRSTSGDGPRMPGR